MSVTSVYESAIGYSLDIGIFSALLYVIANTINDAAIRDMPLFVITTPVASLTKRNINLYTAMHDQY